MARFAGVDYLHIDSQFTEQELMVRQTARQFVEDRVIPLVRDSFRDGRFPKELIPELGRLGFLGANLEGYGCAGMSNVEYGLLAQELERADSGMRSFISVQGALVMYPILTYGSEEQKERWLSKMQSGEALGCFGLTEPGFGSNPAGMLTKARQDGGHWILDGEKTWITNGSIADVALVWARTPEGIRGFLVEKGTPGFSASELHGKMSMRMSVTSSLSMSDCRVPSSCMLPCAKGLKAPLSCLSQARYGIGWGVIGILHHAQAVRQQTDRVAPARAGKAGMDDHRDYEGAAPGAAGRAFKGSREGGAGAHIDVEAQQRRDGAGMRAPEPRPAGRERNYGRVPYHAAHVQPGDGEDVRGHGPHSCTSDRGAGHGDCGVQVG